MVFSIFNVEKCCFCMDLKVGSTIIAYLDLILQIALAVLTINCGISFYHAMYYGYHDGMSEAAIKKAILTAEVNFAIMCIILALVIIHLIFCLLLIIGIYKAKAPYVKAYVYMNIIYIIFYVILFLVSLSMEPSVPGVLRDIVVIGLCIYFTMIVKFYYISVACPPEQKQAPSSYSPNP